MEAGNGERYHVRQLVHRDADKLPAATAAVGGEGRQGDGDAAGEEGEGDAPGAVLDAGRRPELERLAVRGVAVDGPAGEDERDPGDDAGGDRVALHLGVPLRFNLAEALGYEVLNEGTVVDAVELLLEPLEDLVCTDMDVDWSGNCKAGEC